MKVLSSWLFPVISGLVWVGMLMGMLIHWAVDTHKRLYPSMGEGQTIAYISDIGAQKLKPLFIAGSIVTTLCLDAAFLAERWYRHTGRLARNTSTLQKVLSGLSIVFAAIGTVGLCCLSGFDTYHYPELHDIFLLLFIAGYLLSAIFICWGYQRMGINYREYRELRISFWVKLFFVLIELVLAIAFVACTFTKHYDAGAVLEWTIAFVFTFYVLSFCIDLWPAAKTDSDHLFPTLSKRGAVQARQMEDTQGHRSKRDSQQPLHF